MFILCTSRCFNLPAATWISRTLYIILTFKTCFSRCYKPPVLFSCNNLFSCVNTCSCTCMECPVGLRGNLKVSLKEGSLSCRQTLVFFLMILFWVATFTTYNFTYRSEGKFEKWEIWVIGNANYLKAIYTFCIQTEYSCIQSCAQIHTTFRPGRWSGLLNL